MLPGKRASRDVRVALRVCAVGLILLILVAVDATLRIHLALDDPGFDANSSAALLRSDPGMLVYFSELLVESGQWSPTSWFANTSIEHPVALDIPSLFTVGQEYLVAWVHKLQRAERPLHMTWVLTMAWVASCALLGVYGLARELTRSRWLGICAAVLWIAMPANHRTVGFIAMREDLALPLFALHLWALAWAARSLRHRWRFARCRASDPDQGVTSSTWLDAIWNLGTTLSWVRGSVPRGSPPVTQTPRRVSPGLASAARFLLAGLLAGVAAGTWHGMGFVLTLEASCFLWVGLLRGRSPFAGAPWTQRGVAGVPAEGWALLVGLGSCGLAIPALRATAFVFSAPFAIALALVATAHLARPGQVRRARVAMLASCLVFGLAGLLLAPSGHFSHVRELLLAKLMHRGQLPADPQALSFDARLLWQGPFATSSLDSMLSAFGWVPLPVVLWLASELVGWTRRTRANCAARKWSHADAVLQCSGALALLAAWTVQRNVVLPGLILPVAGVVAFARLNPWRVRILASLRQRAMSVADEPPTRPNLQENVALLVLPAAGLLGFLQLLAFLFWAHGYVNPWYQPESRGRELASMVAAVAEHVPEGAAVTADFMNSSAILAGTRRPIVMQPKWENAASRERVHAFWQVFYHDSPEVLRSLMKQRFESSYLLIDRDVLWTMRVSRYVAGLANWQDAQAQPPAGSAAAALLNSNDADLPVGYSELWRSDTGSYRLFFVAGS